MAMKNLVPVSLDALADLRKFESRPIPQCPLSFSGTLEEFYEEYAVHTLPPVDAVEYYHELLRDHCRNPNAVFLVRYTDPDTRKLELRTAEGERYRPTDNSPAWWFHFITFNNFRIQPEDFAEALKLVPVHRNDVRSRLRTSINSAEWYVAHIFDFRGGNKNPGNWTRVELERRFLRTVHLCNTFYVPNPKTDGKRTFGRLAGENPLVIAYFRARYAERYGGTWRQFFELAGDGRNARVRNGALPFSFSTATTSPSTLAAPINRGSMTEHFVEHHPGPVPGVHYHSWTGKDAVGYHAGLISPREDPWPLELKWQFPGNGAPKHIGYFLLRQQPLAAEGYIRPDEKSGNSRLIIRRRGDELLIELNQSAPSLLLARIEQQS